MQNEDTPALLEVHNPSTTTSQDGLHSDVVTTSDDVTTTTTTPTDKQTNDTPPSDTNNVERSMTTPTEDGSCLEDVEKHSADGATDNVISCVLCLENMRSRCELETHLTEVHSVKQETMDRFMSLLVQSSDKTGSQRNSDTNTAPKIEKVSRMPNNSPITKNSPNRQSSKTESTVDSRPNADNESSEILLEKIKIRSTEEDLILNGRVQKADAEPLDTSVVISLKKVDSKSCNSNNSNNFAAASSLALLGGSGLQGLNQCRQQINSILSQNEFTIKSPSSLPSSQSPASDKISPQLRSLKTELSQKVDYNFNTWNDNDETTKKSPSPPSLEETRAYEAYVAVMTPAEMVKSYEIHANRCHRCQFGYPTATFLQLHKKSAEHRRRKRSGADRKSPSKRSKNNSQQMVSVKTEDVPPHPFKCEVCVESFSEARDILSHYGTTPHMLKLQKHQDSRKHASASNPNASETVPTSKLLSSKGGNVVQSNFTDFSNSLRSNDMSFIGAPLQTGLIAMGQQQTLGEVAIADRPYRCDLCKVCYSLKQQLMTHLKSVQHQTRSAKLLSGTHGASAGVSSAGKQTHTTQNPLMTTMDSEQTNYINNWLRAQNQLLTQNTNSAGPFSPSFLPMLGAASGMFSGFEMPNVSQAHHSRSTKTANVAPQTQDNGATSKRANQHNILSGKAANKRGEIDTQVPETPARHAVSSETISSVLSTRKNDSYGKLSHTSLVKFLENIGFECVMQFNENRQKVKKVITTDSTNQPELTNNLPSAENDKPKHICENNNNTTSESITDIDIKVEKISVGPDLPELQRSTCGACQKEFSSVWVLKAHQEEVHKDVVSHEDVAAFAVDLRESYERKHKRSSTTKKVTTMPVKVEPESTRTTTRLPDVKTSNQYATNQKKTPSAEENAMLQPQIPQMTPAQAAQMLQQYPLLMSMSMMSPMLSMMMPPQNFFNHQPQQQHAPYSGMDPAVAMRLLHQQHQQQQQQQQQSIISSPKMTAAAAQSAAAAAATNQKAARTRINEQQLAILREHFDIHNSPGDVQIREMSERTTLPAKVIKHWFRNTLFKERQRNKDSPYNFNVPLSTTLALSESDGNGIVNTVSGADTKVQLNSTTTAPIMTAESSTSSIKSDKIPTTIKSETNNNYSEKPAPGNLSLVCTESMPTAPSSRSWSPGNLLTNGNPASFLTNPMLINQPETVSTYTPWPLLAGSSGNSSFGIGDIDSRTNRTRFVEAQLSEMQSLFSKNSYPSDEQLSSLAERLNLNLRTVATWFQNARQKLRRVVERSGQEKIGIRSKADGSPDSNNKLASNFSKEAMSLSLKVGSDYDNEDGQLQLDSNINHAKYLRNLANQSNSISSAEGEGSELNNSGFSLPDGGDESMTDGRRMRTNIRPDQLQYLYERFRENTFPSCTELDDIAKAVDLNKPVVQIWFQNTRARERKKEHASPGQQRRFKKRTCPFCEEPFRDKKSLKSHIALKHAGKYPPRSESQIGMNNILVEDSREELSRLAAKAKSVGNWLNSTTSSSSVTPGNYLPSFDSLSMTTNRTNLIGNEILRLQYEESVKKYMEEFSRMTSGALQSQQSSESRVQPETKRTISDKGVRELKSSSTRSFSESKLEDSPLDLSMATRRSGFGDEIINKPSASGSSSSQKPQYIDDSHLEFYSDNEDGNVGYDQGDAGSTFSQSSRNLYGPGSKRYRTQMSDLQIQVMRTIFTDSKMPTITECETLGHELGLPRRVVQVWFQNARAKEKKAVDGTKRSSDASSQHGVGASSGSGSSMVTLSNLATEDRCDLCCTKYTAQDTQQDHLYSRGHVGKVKALLQHQERHSVGQMGDDVESVLASNQQYSFDSRNQQHSSNGGHSTPVKRRSRSQKLRDRKTANADAMSPITATSSAAAATTQLLTGHLPVDLMLGMMPMYQGMGGFYPGGARMPMMSQNVLPGLMYDPASYGIQLSMLQIPAKAIRKVEERIKDPNCSITHYTQDCLSFNDLKKQVSADDWSIACKAHVDVGYICRQCSVVWPRREDCVAHQRARCYAGVRLKDVSSILKLEQQQFECRACQLRHSTVDEYRRHCETKRHQDARKDWIRTRTSSTRDATTKQRETVVVGEVITIDGSVDHGRTGNDEKRNVIRNDKTTANNSNENRANSSEVNYGASVDNDQIFSDADRTESGSPDRVSLVTAGSKTASTVNLSSK